MKHDFKLQSNKITQNFQELDIQICGNIVHNVKINWYYIILFFINKL